MSTVARTEGDRTTHPAPKIHPSKQVSRGGAFCERAERLPAPSGHPEGNTTRTPLVRRDPAASPHSPAIQRVCRSASECDANVPSFPAARPPPTRSPAGGRLACGSDRRRPPPTPIVTRFLILTLSPYVLPVSRTSPDPLSAAPCSPSHSRHLPVQPRSSRTFRKSLRSSDTFAEQSQLSPVKPKSIRKFSPSIGNRSVQRSRTSGERPGRESTDTRRGRGLHEAARSRVRKHHSTPAHACFYSQSPLLYAPAS